MNKRRLRRRCEAGAECEHYDYPKRMMVLGENYQATCAGCGRVGPVVKGGPWGAERALYYSPRRGTYEG